MTGAAPAVHPFHHAGTGTRSRVAADAGIDPLDAP